uniref:Unannotated protein n=1 Tax=freshwater metagenome TaxID=449393 RepID=A0A6J5ZTX1_9ZZZZ
MEIRRPTESATAAQAKISFIRPRAAVKPCPTVVLRPSSASVAHDASATALKMPITVSR